jgi:hypothetical protein
MWQNPVKIMSSLEPHDLILRLSSFQLNICEVDGSFFIWTYFSGVEGVYDSR